MKKTFVVFAVIISVIISACGSISSIPHGSFSYPNAVSANESSTFTGSGLQYASARADAIKEGISGGYTKIIAEVIERNQVTGFVDVTLVMTK